MNKTSLDSYERTITESAIDSLMALEKDDKLKWEKIREATISCLLGQPTNAHLYDRKFLVQKTDGGNYTYDTLVPQVRHGSRIHLWDTSMSRIAEEESLLLSACAQQSTLNSARGQHFEHIAIQRFFKHGVVASIGSESTTVDIDLAAKSFQNFRGRQLPAAQADGIYVPYHTKFPAIDLVLKQGTCVIGVQLHVNPHEDVVTRFEGMCKAAGWHNKFNDIILLYLSPDKAVKDLVSNRVNPSLYDISRLSGTPVTSVIRRVALSRESFECLRDIQWPPRCSVDSPYLF